MCQRTQSQILWTHTESATDAGYAKDLANTVRYNEKQMATFMRIIIRLFDKGQFFTLRLIQAAWKRSVSQWTLAICAQPTFDRVCLLQFFQGQDKQLRIVLIRKRPTWNIETYTVHTENRFYLRERDGSKFPTFKPMHRGSVDGNSFFGTDVRSIFEVSMLPLLLSLQVKAYRSRSKQYSGIV